ncbi:MAG: response regulator [Vicinamibacteria bacterium]
MSHVTPTLLLADDSVTIQRVIELTFADEDVQVIAVGDGKQAIDRVQSERPDIVLADIGMPKRTGYDVAQFVKTQPALAGIPVLLLTGAFEAVDDARVRDCGADGVLVKPFEPTIVISRVKELLGLRPPKAPAATARLITSPETPVARPVASPAPPAPPVLRPGSWDDLRQETGLGPETASVEVAASGDDYFDSLDAAFDNLDARLSNPDGEISQRQRGAAPSSGPARPAPPAAESVFEVADEWFGTEAAPPSPVAPAPVAPPVVEARRAPEAVPLAVPPPPAPPVRVEAPAAAPAPVMPVAYAAPPSVADAFAVFLAAEEAGSFGPSAKVEVTDELVDRVAARVAEKLAMGEMSAEVRAIVTDAAERLVREEIRRIRGAAERRR